MASERSISDEKVYQFVSDPGHNETLSGRVRAACVNCRRKKMKCSGQIPCATCIEKSVACEGYIARRKPSRNTQHSQHSQMRVADDVAGSCSGLSDSTRQQDAPERDGQRRVQAKSDYFSARGRASLRKLQTDGGNNFAYAENSNAAYGERPGYNARSRNNSYQLLPSPADYYQSAPSSPTTYQSSEIASMDRRVSEVGDSVPSSATSNPTRASQLLDAARALEEQAQMLRRLALQKGDEDVVVDELARQTVALAANSAPLLHSGHFTPDQGTYDVTSLQLAGYGAESNLGQAIEEYSFWQGPNSAVSTMTTFEQPLPGTQQSSVYMSPSPMDPPKAQWQARAWQDLARSAPTAGMQVQWQAVRQTQRDRQGSQLELNSFTSQQPTGPGSFNESHPWEPLDGT